MPDPQAQSRAFACVLEYDGRAYYGWQRLRDKPTVQGALEQAIEEAFAEQVKVRGAGRTDRGAHALGQVAGFRLASGPDPDALLAGLNRVLPADIRVRSTRVVPDDFHPRQAATGKRYDYKICDAQPLPVELEGRVWKVRPGLNVAAMRAALAPLLGRHDFASFATPTRFGQETCVRELRVAEVEREGPVVVFGFEADSFLYHMVRNLVRLIVKVGEERLSPEQVAGILAARDRQASPGSAPASGLYLVWVDYPDA